MMALCRSKLLCQKKNLMLTYASQLVLNSVRVLIKNCVVWTRCAQCNFVARSRNHYYLGKVTVLALCDVDLHGTVNFMKYLGVRVKCLILSAFNHIQSVLGRFLLGPSVSNYGKIRPVGAVLIHTDRRTNITKLIDVCKFDVILTLYRR